MFACVPGAQHVYVEMYISFYFFGDYYYSGAAVVFAIVVALTGAVTVEEDAGVSRP